MSNHIKVLLSNVVRPWTNCYTLQTKNQMMHLHVCQPKPEYSLTKNMRFENISKELVANS